MYGDDGPADVTLTIAGVAIFMTRGEALALTELLFNKIEQSLENEDYRANAPLN